VRRRDHLLGDASGEVLHLGVDVSEEGVALPSADEHDGVYGSVGEVNGHGAAAADGVCAEL